MQASATVQVHHNSGTARGGLLLWQSPLADRQVLVWASYYVLDVAEGSPVGVGLLRRKLDALHGNTLVAVLRSQILHCRRDELLHAATNCTWESGKRQEPRGSAQGRGGLLVWISRSTSARLEDDKTDAAGVGPWEGQDAANFGATFFWGEKDTANFKRATDGVRRSKRSPSSAREERKNQLWDSSMEFKELRRSSGADQIRLLPPQPTPTGNNIASYDYESECSLALSAKLLPELLHVTGDIQGSGSSRTRIKHKTRSRKQLEP